MKSTRNLLVPLIILILLVVGTIVYFVVDNTKHGNPDNTTAQYVEVVSVSPSDIDTISVRAVFTESLKLTRLSQEPRSPRGSL